MEKEGKEGSGGAAAVDVQKFAAPVAVKAATIGRERREEERVYANSVFRMYILPFALTFSLYSLSLLLSFSALQQKRCIRRPIPPHSAFFMGMRRHYSFPIEVVGLPRSMCWAGLLLAGD